MGLLRPCAIDIVHYLKCLEVRFEPSPERVSFVITITIMTTTTRTVKYAGRELYICVHIASCVQNC